MRRCGRRAVRRRGGVWPACEVRAACASGRRQRATGRRGGGAGRPTGGAVGAWRAPGRRAGGWRRGRSPAARRRPLRPRRHAGTRGGAWAGRLDCCARMQEEEGGGRRGAGCVSCCEREGCARGRAHLALLLVLDGGGRHGGGGGLSLLVRSGGGGGGGGGGGSGCGFPGHGRLSAGGFSGGRGTGRGYNCWKGDEGGQTAPKRQEGRPVRSRPVLPECRCAARQSQQLSSAS